MSFSVQDDKCFVSALLLSAAPFILFWYISRCHSVNPIFCVCGFGIVFNRPIKQNYLENLYINIIYHLVLVKKMQRI